MDPALPALSASEPVSDHPHPQLHHPAPAPGPSPPAKRARVDSSVTVTVGTETIIMVASAFSKLENFITHKINSADKKPRNPIVKKAENSYEIKRGPAEFQVLRNYLEGRPLSKIRDADKKKKVLKEAKFYGFPNADYEALSSAISLPTFKGAPERNFLKAPAEESCYEHVCINKKFVVGGGPDQVHVWSTTTKQLLHTLQVPRSGHRRHTLVTSRSAADINFLIAASGLSLTAWNLETGARLVDFTPSNPSSLTIHASTANTTTSSNGSPSTSTSTTATPASTSSSSGNPPPPAAPSPAQIAYKNNHLLMCTGHGKELYFLQLDLRASPATCATLVSFTREGGGPRVSCCDFYQTPDGKYVATLGCEDGSILLYNLSPSADAKPNLIRSIEAHYAKDAPTSSNAPPVSAAVTHVRAKRDALHLVSAGCDGSVAIWDLAKDGKVLTRFDTNMKMGVHAMDIDDDDSVCIVGAAHDFNVRVFDLASGEALKNICVDEKRSAKFDVHAVGYCADFVVAGVSDSRVRLLKWRRE